MLAVRFHQQNGVVQVSRLHHALTLAAVQRTIDLAIDAGTPVQLWGANDEWITFDPRECRELQVLELQRG